MINNILKVYGEDLINSAINLATISADNILKAGSTMGALCVNVFATSGVDLAGDDLTITILHAETEDGTFATLDTIVIAEDVTAEENELMATLTLPQTSKEFIKATATSSTTNTGSIRVTLGYLAR